MISILDTLSLLWPFSSQSVALPKVRIPVAWAEVWHETGWSEVEISEAVVDQWACVAVFVEVNGVLTMPFRQPINTEFVVGRGCVVRAYLPIGPAEEVGSIGDPVTQADVDEVTLTVTSDGEAVTGYDGLALDVEDVILDTLQGVSDPRVDGANLVVNIPSAAFPDADTMATVVIVVNGTDSDKSWVIEARGRVREAGTP